MALVKNLAKLLRCGKNEIQAKHLLAQLRSMRRAILKGGVFQSSLYELSNREFMLCFLGIVLLLKYLPSAVTVHGPKWRDRSILVHAADLVVEPDAIGAIALSAIPGLFRTFVFSNFRAFVIPQLGFVSCE